MQKNKDSIETEVNGSKLNFVRCEHQPKIDVGVRCSATVKIDTASEYAKSQGLPSLKFVYNAANIDKSKIIRWYNNNRQLFDVVVAGVKSLKDSGEIK